MRRISGSALGMALAAGVLACSQNAFGVPDDVTGVTWTLIEVAGVPVDSAALHRPATLLLDSEGRASGSTGCNQFTGSYTIEQNQLRFGAVAMTRMACLDGVSVENEYSAVFEATRNWRVSGDRLELLTGEDVLARFAR